MSALPERATRIAVCAPGTATDDELLLAGAVGRLLGERGCVLVCGGLGGAMAAASRGAREAGGQTIGIIPGYDDRAANPWIDQVICTGLGQARNALVVATGHAVIAVGGGWGTLSEIALALRLGRPVILLGGWAELLQSEEGRARITDLGGHVLVVKTPEAAVDAAIEAAAQSQAETRGGSSLHP
jgi:uncharacterized protein (TIGR00725 family)